MPTLYRKYRPGVFADVTGQDTIVQTLQNEIALARLAHAYLFSGPRGVGKTTLARLFAKAVSCQDRKAGTFEPCNKCSACTQINSGRHIDIIEIDAASQTGVDNVRENIIENANVLPTVLKHKIFIIDEVHMLSTSAFNALLKTLEEPPSHVIFILATTELHKLPATVISRCERFTFKKIPHDKMMARLKMLCQEEKVKVDKEVLERIARKSEGGLRDAESLLGQLLTLNLKEIATEDIQMILPLSSSESILSYITHLVQNEPGEAINLINKQAEEGVNLDQFAYDLLETIRTILLLSMNVDPSVMSADYGEDVIKQLRKFGTALDANRLVALMDLALKRRAEIKSSPLPQLPLELLAVEAAELIASPAGEVRSNPPSTPKPSVPTDKKIEPPPANKPPEPIVKNEESPITHLTSSIKNAITHIAEPATCKTTLDQITSRWGDVVTKAAGIIPSLSFILTMCKGQSIEGNVLVVGVPFALHKEKLETAKNRDAIERSMETIFGERIRLSYVIVQQPAPPAPDTDVTALAAEFGGEVVG